MIEKKCMLYICEYCDKQYFRKHACIKHEEMCYNNPINRRACFSCDKLTKKDFIIEYPDSNRTVNVFYCPVKDAHMITPQVKMKNNAFEWGMLSEDMPVNCDALNIKGKI